MFSYIFLPDYFFLHCNIQNNILFFVFFGFYIAAAVLFIYIKLLQQLRQINQ